MRGTGAGLALLGALVLLGALACGGPSVTAPSVTSSPVTNPTPAAADRDAAQVPDVSASSQSATPSARIPLRVPYSAIGTAMAPLWVAYEAGYFTAEGLDVTGEYIATSTTLTQAMLSGEVQVALGGLEALISSNLSGAGLAGLAVTTDRFVFRVYGGRGVGALGDLRGKKVAVARAGSTTDTVARLLLRRAGLEPDRDVLILGTGGNPEIYAALETGTVEAAVLPPPTSFRADAAGYPVLADTVETPIPFHQAVLLSTRRYIAENDDTMQRVMRAFLQGVARFKQDKAFAKQVIADYTRLDDDHILEQSWLIQDRVMPRAPYPLAEAVQIAIDQAAEQRPEARSTTPADYFDERLLRELDQGGYVSGLYRP